MLMFSYLLKNDINCLITMRAVDIQNVVFFIDTINELSDNVAVIGMSRSSLNNLKTIRYVVFATMNILQ